MILTDEEIALIWHVNHGRTEVTRAIESAVMKKLKVQEPFGYFKAEPFGWTDCAETDEGAVPLYEHSDARIAEAVAVEMDKAMRTPEWWERADSILSRGKP